MQLFFRFLVRYNALILFLVLELFCLSLIVRNNHFQRVRYLHSANAVYGFFDDKSTAVTDYFSLKQQNDSLANLNSRLLDFYYAQQKGEDSIRTEMPAFLLENKDSSAQQYQFLAAHVINRSTNKQYNYLTINKGKNHGVKPDMGVISDVGLVGIVKNVSANYAVVMTLLHKENRTSSEIQRTRNLGSVTWNGLNPQFLQLNDVPSYVPLLKSDKIVSSGFSAIFPPNIPIGTVDEISVPQGDNFYKINLRPATNFETLHDVFLIENKRKPEIQALERESIRE